MGKIKRRISTSPDPELQRATASAVGSSVEGFNLDIRLREFEINQLTQRNNFFMIFQGVLIAGMTQSLGSASPVISFSVCALGMGVSALQVGMAGGAKYWQIRYEASTRSSELAILLKLLQNKKDGVRTFTHDTRLLTPMEIQKIDEWNARNPDPLDQIDHDPHFGKMQVEREVNLKSGNKCRDFFDRWAQKLAILPKWSVSRIPIWVGAFLLIFWTMLWLHTWQIPAITKLMPNISLLVVLTPLKAEP